MKYVLILLCFVLLLSCTKPGPHRNEIAKIEFARGQEWDDFGAAIVIDSSLNYKYFRAVDSSLNYEYHDGNVEQGYEIGRVSKQFWDTLNNKFEKIKFKTIPSDSNSFIKSPSDSNYFIKSKKSFEVIIYWKDRKRRIIRFGSLGSDSVISVLSWLNDSYKSVTLNRVNAPIKFETTFQNPSTFRADKVKNAPVYLGIK